MWVATKADNPGLAAEGPTLEKLKDKVLPMLADLIEENGFDSDAPDIPVYFLAEQSARIVNPRYGVVEAV